MFNLTYTLHSVDPCNKTLHGTPLICTISMFLCISLKINNRASSVSLLKTLAEKPDVMT